MLAVSQASDTDLADAMLEARIVDQVWAASLLKLLLRCTDFLSPDNLREPPPSAESSPGDAERGILMINTHDGLPDACAEW